MDAASETEDNIEETFCLCIEQTFYYYRLKGKQFLSIPHIIQGVRERFDSVSPRTRWNELGGKTALKYAYKILDYWECTHRVKSRGGSETGGRSYCLNNKQ